MAYQVSLEICLGQQRYSFAIYKDPFVLILRCIQYLCISGRYYLFFHTVEMNNSDKLFTGFLTIFYKMIKFTLVWCYHI